MDEVYAKVNVGSTLLNFFVMHVGSLFYNFCFFGELIRNALHKKKYNCFRHYIVYSSTKMKTLRPCLVVRKIYVFFIQTFRKQGKHV